MQCTNIGIVAAGYGQRRCSAAIAPERRKECSSTQKRPDVVYNQIMFRVNLSNYRSGSMQKGFPLYSYHLPAKCRATTNIVDV